MILVHINITDDQKRKIAYDCARSILPSDEDCKEWIEDMLNQIFDNITVPDNFSPYVRIG